MQSFVYAIIVTWNSRRDIQACLRDLFASREVQLGVVMVDNGSTDGTLDLVAKEFPNVVLLKNSENLGFAEGNNIGIHYALEQGAEYVFLLNADAFVEPDTLKQLLGTADADSTVGMVGPSIVSYFDHTHVYQGAHISLDEVDTVEVQGTRRGAAFETDYVPGCAVLARATAVRYVGMLDTEYFSYWEDADWGLRCRRAGQRVVIAPDASVRHKGTLDQVSTKSDLALYLYVRNRYRFAKKFKSRGAAFRFVKPYTCDTLRLVNAERKKADAIVNGWWAAMTGTYGMRFITAPRFLRGLFVNHTRLLLDLLHPIDTLRARIPVRTTLRRVRGKLP